MTWLSRSIRPATRVTSSRASSASPTPTVIGDRDAIAEAPENENREAGTDGQVPQVRHAARAAEVPKVSSLSICTADVLLAPARMHPNYC